MKKMVFLVIAITCFLVSVPAQFQSRLPTYRIFISPGISSTEVNNMLAHINIVLRDYFGEYARGSTNIGILKNEKEFIDFLEREHLLNKNVEPPARNWEGVEYIVYIERQGSKDICQISMITLETGRFDRTPVHSTKPHDIAKSIALLLADKLTDAKKRKALKKIVNSYFLNFWNDRTIDIYYNGIILDSGGIQTTPLSAGIGLTLPLTSPLGFVARFSGTYYDQDQVDLSAGIGLFIQKAGRFTSEIGLLGGYTGSVQGETFISGPYLEPSIGLGFYLTENLKLTATGSFQAAYYLSSKELATKTFGGVKVGLGF